MYTVDNSRHHWDPVTVLYRQVSLIQRYYSCPYSWNRGQVSFREWGQLSCYVTEARSESSHCVSRVLNWQLLCGSTYDLFIKLDYLLQQQCRD